MPRVLPSRPNLEHLRKQAKRWLADCERGDPRALAELRELAALPADAKPRLSDAQHALARDYGFPSWPRLKARVEALTQPPDPVAAFVAAVKAADAGLVGELLERHPELRRRVNDALPGLDFSATPLLAAVATGNRDVVERLLDAGAELGRKSDWWAGGFGVLEQDTPLADYLIERGAVVDVHAAARLGRVDRLSELLRADPGLVRARGGDGKTPLHVAASIEVARLLLDHGADIDALDVDHESTPAQYLVREHPDVARFLVEHGARTDVFLAAALGDLDRLRGHLDSTPECVNAVVGARDFPMRDPRAGGTIYQWTLGGGKSPHRVASESGHDAAFALLLERSAPATRLVAACERGDDAAIRDQLAQHPGLAPKAGDPQARRIVDAAHADDESLVRHLLRAGWPVAARGHAGETALHFAAWHGRLGLVRELLAGGASLTAREMMYSGTPLDWALHGSAKGWHPEDGEYGEVVEALLDAGAPMPDWSEELDMREDVRRVLRRRSEPR